MQKIALLFLLIPFLTSAQSTFEKNYGDAGFQDGLCTIRTPDGGFLTAGRTVDSTGRYDILLLKTDSLGDSLWSKSWGGPSSDFPATITPTADGGYLMSATTYSFSNQPGTNSDWWIFRLDANCDTLWTRIIPNIGNDRMYDILETSDSSILACGWITSQSGYALGTIMKFTANGTLLHTSSLGSGANSHAQSVEELPNGHYMLVGSRFQTTFGADLVELDTALNYITDYFFNLPSTGEFAHHLKPLPQGGYILAAKSGFVINRFDIWLLRLNEQFDTLWTRMLTQRPLRIDQMDEPFGFATVADSGYIMCGQKLVLPTGELKAVVYRMDSSGVITWSNYFGSGDGDSFSDPLLLDDGGFLLTGAYIDSVIFDSDVYFVRTDAFGQVSVPTAAPEVDELPVTVYPNPVHGMFYWKLPVSKLENSSLELYAADGKRVLYRDRIPVNGQLDCTSLPRGIYSCVFRFDGSVLTKKLVIE